MYNGGRKMITKCHLKVVTWITLKVKIMATF